MPRIRSISRAPLTFRPEARGEHAIRARTLLFAGAMLLGLSGRAAAQPWYGEPVVTPTGFRLVDVKTGDLNGDGLVDLVAGSIGTWDHHIFLAGADGHMTEAQAVPGHQWASAATFLLLDENQDQWPDLICPDSTAPTGFFHIWRNDGTGRMVDSLRRLRGEAPLSSGDLDGDGFSDLLTRATPDTVYVYYGSAAGLPETPLALPLAMAGDPPGGVLVRDLRIADVNGDGRGDVILAGQYANGSAVLVWYLGQAGRTFDAGHRLLGPLGYSFEVFDLADLDLDGDLDACVTSAGWEWPGHTSFYRYQGNGEYAFAGYAPLLGKPTFGRMDGDDFWDLAINDGSNVRFYRGPDFDFVQSLHVKDFGFGTRSSPPGPDLICVSHDNPSPVLVYPNVLGLPTSSVIPGDRAPSIVRAFPTVASSRVTFTLSSGAGPRLGIFDAGGHLIRSLPTSGGVAGRWDLRDDGGRPVPAGIYWAGLPEEPAARARIVVLR